MTKSTNTKLSANGKGVQPYIPRDLIEDTGCPLDRGEVVSAGLIPGVGVLLTPIDGPDVLEVILDEH